MRSLPVVFVSVFAACTSSSGMGGDNQMDGGSGSGSGSGSGTLEPPALGFQIVTPEITIQPQEEITYCYYFKTPNAAALTVKKWASAWTAGSHHVILYFANSLPKPEGTIEPDSCGFGGGFNVPQWIYSAQQTPSELLMPADDGAGKPLGMDVKAGQFAMLEIHYNNTGDEALPATATINAEAYPDGTATTKTFAYVTYRAGFTLNANPQPQTITNECNIPAASKVWLMSTHTHKNAVGTRVLNGLQSSTDVVFSATDWEHPGAKRMDNPYYSFASGKLTSECTYVNMTGAPVDEGQSAKTEEMCMAVGYSFPATKPTFCVNGTVF